MWLFGERVTIADNIAKAVWIVSQHIIDLTCSISLILSTLDSSLGCLNMELYERQHLQSCKYSPQDK